MVSFFSIIRRWKILILLNAIYAAAGLAWIILIPYNNAPDENTHFHYSVEFIIQHHRLPVWGVDDIERFRHALSSYNHMPALNYVLYAAGAAMGQKIFGLEMYVGARLVSLAWGLVFLNFLFLAARELCGNYRNALIAAAGVAFIPQVFFSFCYINADAHSLAIAAILGFAMVRLLRNPTNPNIIFAGAAIGLLFSAKYNYYIYFPAIAVLLILAVRQRTISWKTIGRLMLASAVLSLLISGCWFIRNTILYGSPLPLLLSEEFFKSIALTRDIQPVNRGVNIPALVWMVQNGFFGATFNSFFAVFGYLNVGFHNVTYIILQFIIPLIILFFILDLMMTRDRLAQSMLGWLFLLFFAMLAMHVWACLTYDYQPQGRYHFTILVPAALYTGWAITRQNLLWKHAFFFLVMMIWFFIGANILIACTYAPPIKISVSQRDDANPALFTAKRTMKNYYATEKISFGNNAPDYIRVGFSKKFLARYRDFKLELETTSGATNNDWTVNPPEGLADVVFNPSLTAFETCGHDACFVLPLPAKTKSARIEFSLEHRRLYDLE